MNKILQHATVSPGSTMECEDEEHLSYDAEIAVHVHYSWVC